MVYWEETELLRKAAQFIAEYRERVMRGRITGDLLTDDCELSRNLDRAVFDRDHPPRGTGIGELGDRITNEPAQNDDGDDGPDEGYPF